MISQSTHINDTTQQFKQNEFFDRTTVLNQLLDK